MTLKDKATVETVIANEGTLEGMDFFTVWEYRSQEGKRLYAMFNTPTHDMYVSPYVCDPVLLWSLDDGKLQDPS
jgi:hypothetical protein